MALEGTFVVLFIGDSRNPLKAPLRDDIIYLGGEVKKHLVYSFSFSAKHELSQAGLKEASQGEAAPGPPVAEKVGNGDEAEKVAEMPSGPSGHELPNSPTQVDK